MNYQWILFLSLFLFSFNISAQNTVGLQYIDPSKIIGGYNLIYPQSQPDVFLLNECGEIAHQWIDGNRESGPGAVAYLLEDGTLVKAKSQTGATGGAGGVLERLSWNNELLWQCEAQDSTGLQHHDFHPMPNGNILIIVWEEMGFDEILNNGFDTISYTQNSLFFDGIREIDPITNAVVWEWHAWDHLIQDYDATKLNYGNIAEHPERININYQNFTANKPDFLHSNAIDYNKERDQIILSVRNFNEFWIIDHSTTTAEAATSSGGNSGKGGDLIYRWGNPHAYQQAAVEDRQLFRQHDVQWIDDLVDPNYEYYGDILLFNNMITDELSLGQIVEPEWDANTQSYSMESNQFLPNDFAAKFSHPDTIKNYSSSASSIQLLENGTVVMCAARQGRIFELTRDGELAWEYITPMRFGNPITQGFELNLSDNFTFQSQRYPENFPAFEGKDLSPKGYIELEPNTNFCELTSTNEIKKDRSFKIYPNPTNGYLTIESSINYTKPDVFYIYDVYGQQHSEILITSPIQHIHLHLENGIYFIQNRVHRFSEKIMIVNE